MLPFLKKKDSANVGLMVKHRAPDEKPEEDQDDSNAGAKACMAQLISAIHSHNTEGAIEALKDLMEVMDSGDAEPHSYESQNIKAGEQD